MRASTSVLGVFGEEPVDLFIQPPCRIAHCRQRTREIGVRMALGAKRKDVETMVLRQGLTLAVTGVALGLASSLVLTRLMRALLFEVSPLDPITFTSVPLLLALVALLASWLPARRAASIDPLEAIRYE
jgi:ABC-type antimicrobial peptide transport system permease subunit